MINEIALTPRSNHKEDRGVFLSNPIGGKGYLSIKLTNKNTYK